MIFAKVQGINRPGSRKVVFVSFPATSPCHDSETAEISTTWIWFWETVLCWYLQIRTKAAVVELLKLTQRCWKVIRSAKTRQMWCILNLLVSCSLSRCIMIFVETRIAPFLALHPLSEGTRSKWAVKLQRAIKMANPDLRPMPRGNQTLRLFGMQIQIGTSKSLPKMTYRNSKPLDLGSLILLKLLTQMLVPNKKKSAFARKVWYFCLVPDSTEWNQHVSCLFLVRWGRHLEFPAVRHANQRLRMCLCLKVSLFVHFCTMDRSYIKEGRI